VVQPVCAAGTLVVTVVRRIDSTARGGAGIKFEGAIGDD